MVNIEQIEKTLKELIDSGSRIDYLSELRDSSIDLLSKDRSIEEILHEPAMEVAELTDMFLKKKNEYGTQFVSGIFTSIDLFGNGIEYNGEIYGGTTSRNCSSLINQDTLFDLASISKLYTLVLLFKLEQMGLIDLNSRVSDINEDFQNLEDFTLNDLIRFHGDLYTNGNMRDASSPAEAYELLKTVYLKSNTRETNKYTDFGAMILADTIEKVVSKALGKKMRYDEIMKEFLFKPLGLNNTTFSPGIINVAGNANDLGLPHDPKAQVFGRPTGHAGVFATSRDLTEFARQIMLSDYLKELYKSKLYEITFPGRSHGNLGTFVRTHEDPSLTFLPREFSDRSFASQGYTGPLLISDMEKEFVAKILPNAILVTDNKELIKNDKPIGFMKEFGNYQNELVKRILLMYIAKEYYSKYCNVTDKVTESINLNR